MTGQFQRIREVLTKRLPKLGKPKARSAIIQNTGMEEILLATRPQYPSLPIWEKIEHPRDNYFSIYILPLHIPLHPQLDEPVRDLQRQMIEDNVGQDFCRLHDLYEDIFSHLWVAEIQRWTYRPIGLCSFVYRPAPAARLGEGTPAGKDRWWMNMAWLNVAQRNHRVLRNTIPYFKKWHPDFLMARDHPIVNKSFKDNPEHLQNKTGKSLIWG